MRLALGISYNGQAYEGWQSQLSGRTVQDRLEAALGRFTTQPVSTVCAGRTDAGVHALMQVVHFDTGLQREQFSWVRGTNRFLPPDIAVEWALPVPDEFHSRASAIARRYSYLVRESTVRPSVDAGRAFVDSLTLFGLGYSWGGANSLVMPYRIGAMRQGWQDGGTLVRFNIGLEDTVDLIADLERALGTLQGTA